MEEQKIFITLKKVIIWFWGQRLGWGLDDNEIEFDSLQGKGSLFSGISKPALGPT
jgi:hypothetical protein